MIKFFRQNNKKESALSKLSSSGFTLVETLVAISIFTVSLLGIMSVLGSSISSTNYAKRKMTATYLAQEGFEYVRNMRDTEILYRSEGDDNESEWDKVKDSLKQCTAGTGPNSCSFVKPSSTGFKVFKCAPLTLCELYIDPVNGGYESFDKVQNISGDPSGFTRRIWAEEIEEYKAIKVYSKVEWEQGSGSQSITFSGNLFNWIEIAAVANC